MRKSKYIVAICSLFVLLFASSCVEELKTENYYTFTGEMITDYLENRAIRMPLRSVCVGWRACLLPSAERCFRTFGLLYRRGVW